MFLKTQMVRLNDHPEGPGTRDMELVALNLAK